jgi:cardiolipin synthase
LQPGLLNLRLPLLLPSLLSAGRLLLSPVAAAAILDREWVMALAVALVGGLSDAVDGWVARRWKLVTRAGAWLDPVADKVLAVTIFLSLGVVGALPAWLVGLVFGRDVLILVMAGSALLFTRIRDFPPSIWGKLSTVVQIATAVIAMVTQAWPSPGGTILLRVFILATTITTAWSGLHYVWTGIRRLRAPN